VKTLDQQVLDHLVLHHSHLGGMMSDKESIKLPETPIITFVKDSGENLPPITPRPTVSIPPQPDKKK